MVQGCFWHGHTCSLASKPKSNQDYWRMKIETNRARDVQNIKELRLRGWTVLELWECETRGTVGLREKIAVFMQADGSLAPG